MLNSRGDKEKVWDNFFGCFDEYSIFGEVYSQVCQDHGCLINDTTAKKQGITDQCRFWKATENLPPFRLGNKQYWLAHVMYFDPLADSDSDSDDGKGTGRRRRRVVNINRKHLDEKRTKTLTLGSGSAGR